MIKLLDILREGTISLTPSERKEVDKLAPKIATAVNQLYLKPSDNVIPIGFMNYKLADGSDGFVSIDVADDNRTSGAYFRKNDPKNLKDNVIVIQSNPLIPYFMDWKDNVLSTQQTNKAKEGLEIIKYSLRHELIHAKDPALNTYNMKEPYDPTKEEIYYKSWTEFQTMTGQFFEAIQDSVDKILNDDPTSKDIDRINRSLSDLLDFFSGKEKNISNETKELITYTPQSENIFKKIDNFLDKIVGNPKYTGNIFNSYIYYLNKIKQYNPEGYQEFLKDLYKIIDSIKDKIK